MTKVLIAICTFRNPKGLLKLLRSLESQQYDSGQCCVNVLVVDNDPHCSGGKFLENHILALDLKVIQEHQAGLSNARNRCIQYFLESSSEVLIFLDDDEWAPDFWLNSFIQAWEQTKAPVLVGEIVPFFLTDKPEWFEKANFFSRGKGQKEGDRAQHVGSGNSLFHRRVLETLGPCFNPKFNLVGGEDSDYFERARQEGFQAIYSEKAWVYEDVPESRLKKSWVLKRQFRCGGGYTLLNTLKDPSLKMKCACCKEGIKHLLKGFKILFQERDGFSAAQSWAMGLGYIAGTFGLFYKEYKNYRKTPPTQSL